jgi:hypothetical protein
LVSNAPPLPPEKTAFGDLLFAKHVVLPEAILPANSSRQLMAVTSFSDHRRDCATMAFPVVVQQEE